MNRQPDTCQWFKKGTPNEFCKNGAFRAVTAPIAMGMSAEVWLCRKHAAEYNRVQASLRVKSKDKK